MYLIYSNYSETTVSKYVGMVKLFVHINNAKIIISVLYQHISEKHELATLSQYNILMPK